MSQHPKISQLYNQAHSAAGITKKMQIQKLCAAAAAPLVVGLVTRDHWFETKQKSG
jgi:hypothetical protein